MSTKFIQTFYQKSVDEILDQLKYYPFDQKEIRKSISKISDQEGSDQIIDTDFELASLAEKFHQDYPVLAKKFNLDSFHLKTLQVKADPINNHQAVIPTEEEVKLALINLFDQLQDDPYQEISFLGFSINNLNSSDINKILRNYGSKYRCLFERNLNGNEINGVFGKLSYEEKIDNHPDSYRMIIETEKKYGFFKEIAEDPLEDLGYQNFFIDRSKNEFIFKEETKTTIRFIVGNNNTSITENPFINKDPSLVGMIGRNISKYFQENENKALLLVGKLISLMESARNNYINQTEETVSGIIQRNDPKSIDYALNKLKIDVKIYQEIVKISKTNPQDAQKLLELFITERSIPHHPDSKFDLNYQHRRTSMLIGLSAISVNDNQIEVNWSDLENRISDLDKALDEYLHLSERFFKINFIGLMNRSSINQIIKITEKSDQEIDQLFQAALNRQRLDQLDSTSLIVPSDTEKNLYLTNKAVRTLIQIKEFQINRVDIIFEYYKKINEWLVHKLGINPLYLPLPEIK
jgi:hypothetical protein